MGGGGVSHKYQKYRNKQASEERQRCEKTLTWPRAAESTESAETRDLSFS